ncbi:putative MFS family arabinose efflux permease [Paraburkholderia eburnea]|uniref:Putative MFS family arabinose efflux permease n=1 Tax=Paraburkholderia eburnea TaxID=1189126 RepID=A0A2S4LZY6_9BURK|nr:MFS transporter [Paraburkholderia eburnea]POR47957.1 putative MFS family arabinose efflux permease [Paraburkholderia eburnea]PRZ19351.1 putative MFS family arabinose efflux permease [Paraburkholderia eburnea]
MDIPRADSRARHDLAVRTAPHPYTWIVLVLTIGLMLSDYMSRQVLNAVFPALKAVWNLSDAQLGSFNSVVALMVGVLTLPLSILADRWGRVRSIVLMAALWSLATLGCALSTSYGNMLLARALVGLGEASYGAVGPALIMSIFPAHLRSSLTASFMAGAALGSVIGMALGGVIMAHLGWRWAFGAMAGFGVALVVLYRVIVTEARLAPHLIEQKHGAAPDPMRLAQSARIVFEGLFTSVSARFAYLGSGLQVFVGGSLYAWLPSYLNRYYGMSPARAGVMAAGFVLVNGLGMVLCGMLADRASMSNPNRKWGIAMAYCAISALLLAIALRVSIGNMQLVLIAVAMFVVSGTNGPSGAMVANVTPAAIHASVFATLTLANSLLGMAPGPFVTGFVADHIGLHGALHVLPCVALVSMLMFALGRRHYAGDLERAGRRTGL